MDSYYDDGGCCIVHPDSSNIVLTGGKGPITQTNWSFVVSYSTNAGQSWTRCNLSGTLSGWCYTLAAVPLPSSRVYAGGQVTGSGAVYVSTDRGRTWNPTATAPADTVWKLLVDPADDRRVFAATAGGLYRTTDGGTTWTNLRAPRRLRAVQLFPACPDTIFVAGDSGVALSVDGGAGWTTMNQGLSTRRVNCLGFTENGGTCLLAGTEGGAVFAWGFPTGLAAAPLPTPGRVSPCQPNPFVSCGRMVGREHEEFVLRDHAGREVGRFRGARIGVGLPAGVYFCASPTSPGTPVRVVKTR